MTSYVLGAGASRHAGYPLCSELWPHITDYATKTPTRREFQEAIDTIVRLNGPVNDAEAVFTNLSLGQAAFAAVAQGERRRLARVIRCCIADSFDEIAGDGQRRGCYSALASKLAAGDAVVTFNYDVALEIEVIRAGKFRVRDGYGGLQSCCDEPGSDVKLFKLHGSTNWIGEVLGPRLGSLSAGGPHLLGPCVDNRRSLLPGYPAAVLDGRVRGRMTDQSVTMILPTYAKRFGVETSLGDEWEDFYEDMWTQADEALSRSDRVVIIGYSMPQADELARRLLLGCVNKGVILTVCCGEGTRKLERKFCDAGFTNVHHLDNPTFEGFLAH
jgi:hypothetical protein